MALEIKLLGAGIFDPSSASPKKLLADSPVASGKAVIVKTVRLVNTCSAALAFDIYLTTGSTPTDVARISPKSLSLAPGAMYVDDSEITLEYNYGLRIDVTVPSGTENELHYSVSEYGGMLRHSQRGSTYEDN
jgi:hypothetical protein